MITIKNKVEIKEIILSIWEKEIENNQSSINRLSLNPDKSNIEDIQFSQRRIKIVKYMIHNLDHCFNNFIRKIESNPILDMTVLDEDKKNIFIKIYYGNDDESSKRNTRIKGFSLSDVLNNEIAYINIYDLVEDNIFASTNMPLNIFLAKFDNQNLRTTFFKNKLNTIENRKKAFEQIKHIKNFQVDFKQKNVFVRAHISFINKIEDIENSYLIKIGKYGHLFLNKESIYKSIMIILSDFEFEGIRAIIKNYRKILKIEQKTTFSNNIAYNIKFLQAMHLIDKNRCIIYEEKDKNKILLINIDKEDFQDVLNSKISLINYYSQKQEETDFTFKEFLKHPNDTVETIFLMHY